MAWPLGTQTNHVMKNFTLSFEGLLLILLLLVGIYGARAVMQADDTDSPGFASPRQEAPAMVMVPQLADDTF